MNIRSQVARDLRALTTYPDRHVGGPGNQAATAMFAARMAECGWVVTRRVFDCVEWEYGAAVVETAGERFGLHVGPYSLAVDTVAPLVAAARVEDLETGAVTGKVVLIHGDLAAGQIMPTNFTFYNPESHQRVVRALARYAPAAVIAATGRDPEMVGGQYPFPLFEDGDLDVPNAYLKDVDGERLRTAVGQDVHLRIDSRRVPATAEHVIASRPGSAPGRIVVSAHIDSRQGSPGALDNASGVAVLLALGELLAGYTAGPTLELVPYNGEDHYANPGEMLWLAENEGRFDDILLGINIDDLGLRGTTNHVSLYECPDEIQAAVRQVMARNPGTSEGPAWFQGDHMVLVQNGRPAIALASSEMARFMADYAHTARDAIDLADSALIAEAALFVRDLLAELAGLLARG